MKRLINRFWYGMVNVGIGYSTHQFVDKIQPVEKHTCTDTHLLGAMSRGTKHQIIVSPTTPPSTTSAIQPSLKIKRRKANHICQFNHSM